LTEQKIRLNFVCVCVCVIRVLWIAQSASSVQSVSQEIKRHVIQYNRICWMFEHYI